MKKIDYKYPLALQLFYALLCFIWNAVALYQIEVGVQPIGPTASVAVMIGAVFFVVLLASAQKFGKDLVYVFVSFLVCILGALSVHSGLTKSPDLWPSEFWRYAGVSINAVGVLSFVAVLVVFFNRGASRVRN